MSRIALLTRSYLNSQSANAICAGNIAKALRASGHDVELISYEKTKAVLSDDSVHIVSLTNEKTELNGVHSRVNSIIKSIRGEVNHFVDQDVTALYYGKLCQLERICQFDIVVSFMFPLESVQAIALYKKKNPAVRAVAYELDSASDGITQSRFPFLYNRAIEKWLVGIYRIVDTIVIMASHKDYWIGRFGKEFGMKERTADIPVLSKHSVVSVEKNQRVRMIYSGLLERKYRSPTYLLRILRLLKSQLNFEFFFYSRGDCEEEIATTARTGVRIQQKGYVSKEELNEALQGATVLVSIGNSISRSVPSKIIDYMSFGKPIIHFASQHNDVCKEYLSRYPLSLIIDEATDANSACQQLLCFISQIENKTVCFDEISHIFFMNDPQYSVRQIIENTK